MYTPVVLQWNVYLIYCDNILLVVESNIAGKEVETMLDNPNYYCKELE